MKNRITAFITLASILLASFAYAGAGNIMYSKFQVINNLGVPLSGGLVYTYETGTTTPKTTYSDSALSSANTNPVVLDSRGEALIFGAGEYKIIVKDSSGITIWTADPVSTPETATNATSAAYVVNAAQPYIETLANLTAVTITAPSAAKALTITTADGGTALTVDENSVTAIATADINGGTMDGVTIGGGTIGAFTQVDSINTITLDVDKDQNVGTTATITNDTDGTSAYAGISLNANGSDGLLAAFPNNYTGQADWADSTVIQSASTSSGGLVLASDGADVSIQTTLGTDALAVSSGVTTIASSVLTTADINGGTIDGVTIGGGNIGTVTPVNDVVTLTLDVDKDQNAGTVATIVNDTDGTSAYAGVRLDANGSDGLLASYPNNYTGQADWADSTVLQSASTSTGGLVLASDGADVRVQTTLGTDVVVVDSSGTTHITAPSGATAFSVTTADAGDSFTIDSNGNVIVPTGNITIEDGKLDIENGTNIKNYITRTDAAASTSDISTEYYRGLDSGTNTTIYTKHITTMEDITDGSEDGSWTLQTMTAGTLTDTIVAASGNVGIGTAPETWDSTFTALQVGLAALSQESTDKTNITTGAYYDDTDNRWEYTGADQGTRYLQQDGQHAWSNASLGSAGGAITWSEKMRLDFAGNLEISTGGLIPDKVTADPCGTYPEGSIFYNDTSDYMCFCTGAGVDVQMHSPGTACF